MEDFGTQFEVVIDCTKEQSSVLESRLNIAMEDQSQNDNPDFCGYMDLVYGDGSLHIYSDDDGQPYELGVLIAKWQVEVGHTGNINYMWVGTQDGMVIDSGRVDIENGKMFWTAIDNTETVVRQEAPLTEAV